MLFRLLVLLTLILSATQLPAPVIEEEQPSPTVSSKPKSRPTADRKQSAGAPEKAKPKISFAGNWSGTASGEIHAPLMPTSYSDRYNIQISPDEQTVTWTASKWFTGKFQATVRRNGNTLSWSYEKHQLTNTSIISSSLTMNADGTATFEEQSTIASGFAKGSNYKVRGIFNRSNL